ncbi:acyltransferase [Aerococcus urinaeequi]
MSGEKRSKIIMSTGIFNNVGKGIAWQPRSLPADPELIRLHNNISVAANVTFITHDVFKFVFNKLDLDITFGKNLGCIEVMDNVAIGSNVVIMPNVKIGPNAIIGAGSVVTKDVAEGMIVAGNPARVIGEFDDLLNRRIQNDGGIDSVDKAWELFEKKHAKI